MESSPDGGKPNLKENKHDELTKNDANNVSNEDALEATKLPETKDVADQVESSLAEITSEAVVEEPIVKEQQENLARENSTGSNVIDNSENSTTNIDDCTVIKEISDSAISDDNITSNSPLIEEPAEEKATTSDVEELNESTKNVSEIIELSESDSSDRNIVLPLIDSLDEESPGLKDARNYEATDEIVSNEVCEKSLSESVEEHVREMVQDTISVSDEPIINEAVELSAEPPILEETTTAEDVTIINGMPVLHKEVINLENHEINENTISEAVVVLLPSSVMEPEVITEETDMLALDDEDVKDSEPVKEFVIPPHILGRNIDRPMEEEPVRNGKVRKPRLGVKIPNRNLTSQIVSGKVIEEEVMERSRLRNATADIPSGGDIFFAKKLTQRLAKKLTEKSTGSKTSPATSSTNSDVKPFLDTSGKITDNSDLIALLEGDDDVDWTPTDSSKKLEKKTPEWERETALKQLRELPKHGKGSRTFITKTITMGSPGGKATESKKESVDELPLLIEDNSEPKFSMGVVTKTYTRKRKSSNDIKIITTAVLQSQKKLHIDKDKSSTTFSPQSPQLPSKQSEKSSPKSIENAKGSTPKLQKLKHSALVEKKEMPTLKKESPIVNQHKSSTPKVQKVHEEKQYPQISADKSHPQVIITQLPTKAPETTPQLTPQLSPNTYISKSSRIVKKKKIWDPDEDTTPKYLKPSPVKKIVEVVEKTSDKKVYKSDQTIPVPDKPAVLKPNNERATPKKPTLKKMIMKKKKPKRLTEVDRLLMDEGAVNLLYSVKNTEELQNVNKKKTPKSVISLDRAQRELLNKTNEIKNDLQINSTKDCPISLRKKEGGIKISPGKDLAAAVLQRKKSTGSAHSPPASPAFYNQHAEASRIIRRHSSSSFSSDNDGEKSSHKKMSEPQKKKTRSHSDRHSSSIGVDKQLLSEEMAKNFNNAMPIEPKYTQFETFNVRSYDNFIQVILSPSGPFGKTTLTVQALQEITAVLKVLQNDDECRAVLLTSSGSAFCQGIDYKELVSNDATLRQTLAENYAKCIKDFLSTISNFPKLLIAGVHGHTVGLGVTMLPLFDMVLASDTATFSTPYTTVGCAAEGGILLTLPHVMHSALASELLFAARKLTAGEAFRLGLVTRTLWPDKFQDELISSLKITSGQSLQSIQAIKSQLRQHLIVNIRKSLEAESSVLVQHWTSTECQSKFLDYNIESK